MVRTLIGIGIGAVVGGVVGYSQILCFDGTCPLTGSWVGGALIGGFLGMMVTGGCPACCGGACALPQRKRDEEPADGGDVQSQ
jgi:hypothetical protein